MKEGNVEIKQDASCKNEIDWLFHLFVMPVYFVRWVVGCSIDDTDVSDDE